MQETREGLVLFNFPIRVRRQCQPPDFVCTSLVSVVAREPDRIAQCHGGHRANSTCGPRAAESARSRKARRQPSLLGRLHLHFCRLWWPGRSAPHLEQHSQPTPRASIVHIVRSPLVGRGPVQEAVMVESTEDVSGAVQEGRAGGLLPADTDEVHVFGLRPSQPLRQAVK